MLESRDGDRFLVRTGAGQTVVVLNGWTKSDDNSVLVGDRVSVRGTMDASRPRSVVNADVVYVERLRTYMHATNLPPQR